MCFLCPTTRSCTNCSMTTERQANTCNGFTLWMWVCVALYYVLFGHLTKLLFVPVIKLPTCANEYHQQRLKPAWDVLPPHQWINSRSYLQSKGFFFSHMLSFVLPSTISQGKRSSRKHHIMFMSYLCMAAVPPIQTRVWGKRETLSVAENWKQSKVFLCDWMEKCLSLQQLLKEKSEEGKDGYAFGLLGSCVGST